MIELIKVVRRVEFPVVPIESQPAHVRFDGFHIFEIFLARIGIVETQVTEPAKFGGETEVETNGFRVADMKIAIGLRRESRVHPTLIFALFQIFRDDIADEMRRHGLHRRRHRPGNFFCCFRVHDFIHPDAGILTYSTRFYNVPLTPFLPAVSLPA